MNGGLPSDEGRPGEGGVAAGEGGAQDRGTGTGPGRPGRRWSDHGGVKLTVLGLLVLLLLIPMSHVRSLIQERARRQDEVVNEVSREWAGSQSLLGPILALPCEPPKQRARAAVTPSAAQVEVRGTGRGERVVVLTESDACPALHFLPEEVRWSGRVTPEVRYRGIFEVVVYEAHLEVEGVFAAPDPAALGVAPERVLWRRATLSMGLGDLKGMVEGTRLRWGGEEVPFVPGAGAAAVLSNGLHATLPGLAEAREPIPFSFRLVLRGSDSLAFLPAGEETWVKLTSPWPSPGFSGAFLPRQRQIGAGGFTASWQVPYFARNLPQAWVAVETDEQALHASTFGVDLVLPADGYQRTERSVKYGVLFILLTFLTFFLLELASPRRLHPMHYLLVGFALCLFYVLLLALAEHVGFGIAYSAAAAATVVLIGAYGRSILAGGRRALLVPACLAGLYAYLYGLLQAEDHSLLMGALGLFAILALVMYLTRHLDWRDLRFRPAAGAAGGGG